MLFLMPRYSAPRDPDTGADEFGYVAGNYVIWLRDGSAYPGRQGSGSNRIRSATQRWGSRAAAVQFMTDHADDECIRADREVSMKNRLDDEGVHLHNKIEPSVPSGCRPRGRDE